jgi:hypothetical protein
MPQQPETVGSGDDLPETGNSIIIVQGQSCATAAEAMPNQTLQFLQSSSAHTWQALQCLSWNAWLA